MTEADWLAATDPTPLLEALLAAGEMGTRRLNLYVLACARALGPPYPGDLTPALLEEQEHRLDHLDALPVWRGGSAAGHLQRLMIGMRGLLPLYQAVLAPSAEARPRQAALVRDIFRNPARAAPLVRAAWRTEEVVSEAAAIYADRAFERLPQLADTLEKAGCADGELLGHLRSPGPHVRGCWAVDLLVGKE
jgi:hypothetical protein